MDGLGSKTKELSKPDVIHRVIETEIQDEWVCQVQFYYTCTVIVDFQIVYQIESMRNKSQDVDLQAPKTFMDLKAAMPDRPVIVSAENVEMKTDDVLAGNDEYQNSDQGFRNSTKTSVGTFKKFLITI